MGIGLDAPQLSLQIALGSRPDAVSIQSVQQIGVSGICDEPLSHDDGILDPENGFGEDAIVHPPDVAVLSCLHVLKQPALEASAVGILEKARRGAETRTAGIGEMIGPVHTLYRMNISTSVGGALQLVIYLVSVVQSVRWQFIPTQFVDNPQHPQKFH